MGLALLTLCQGLFMTNNVAFIAINGLVGLSLAPFGWMATLPVMGYVVGGALSTGLVARSQAKWGRRVAFQIGLAVAFGSALLCAYAVISRNFWLLCFATLVAGYYNANAALYRFAAAELAGPSGRDKAVSWVLAGGLIGAVIGPNLAVWARDALPAPFAAVYLVLAGVALVSAGLMQFIRFPAPPGVSGSGSGRSVRELLRQPAFVVAAASGALAYGVMNLLMAATPLAMQQCGHSFGQAAFVLQWHVVGMFAPGFFTGHLITRFGSLRVMAVGLALNLLCVAIALSGEGMAQFTVALALLGVGWNFLFTGATTLALSTYRPEEKDRAQGFLNFCVFATLAVSAFSSGALVTSQGWWWLNAGSLLPLAVIGAALLALMRQPPRGTPGAVG
jgi:MFS family permease